jgi:hypothetical protein
MRGTGAQLPWEEVTSTLVSYILNSSSVIINKSAAAGISYHNKFLSFVLMSSTLSNIHVWMLPGSTMTRPPTHLATEQSVLKSPVL